MGRELMYAAGLGLTWCVLCVSVAAGLYLGKRVYVMVACRCDWADAGLRIKIAARRRYGLHRRGAGRRDAVLTRARAVLDDPTHVISAVKDDTAVVGETRYLIEGDCGD